MRGLIPSLLFCFLKKKMQKTIKKDKGQAGLTILLSIIVMLFIIGLIVMIFSLMGAELQTSTWDTTTATSTNESLLLPTTAGITLTAGNTLIAGRKIGRASCRERVLS